MLVAIGALIGLVGVALFVGVGTHFGWRLAKADHKINRLLRDDAVYCEAERAEHGIYCSWNLAHAEDNTGRSSDLLREGFEPPTSRV